MSDIALRTVGLGKMYQIGGQRESYRTLRDTLVQTAKRPIERIRHPGAATHTSDEIWALKDVDLEVAHDEVLGVIGRNGSGKSTLLKVLSHITEPTEGRAEIRGRVASLLEVGTGFHQELTGRENIQLNGAILGMSRAEIKSKFDEIVEFSEIGRFLDTPVKRYSSGMYVRLAFAVASSLDPEILIVDEVLAVGDAEFQKKCLGKMEQVATSGRTVVFVSHNMVAVRALCTRCALLEEGHLVRVGDVDSIVDEYIEMGGTSGTVFTLRQEGAEKSSASVSVAGARLLAVTQDADSLTSVSAAIDCVGREELAFNVEWRIVTMTGHPVVFGAPELFRRERLQSRMDAFTVDIDVCRLPLASGSYRLELALTQAFRRIFDTVHLQFRVEACDPGGVGFDFHYGTNWAATFADDKIAISDGASEILQGDDGSGG
jgi:ABC-type polysaccharide/polyol phosphate transport system ATPase subunit